MAKKKSHNYSKGYLRDLGINILASFTLIVAGIVFGFLPKDIVIAVAITLFVSASVFVIVLYRKKSQFSELPIGIKNIWRNENLFFEDQNSTFTEYCRTFIKGTPEGQTVRVLGFDWVEIFPDTIVLGDDIFQEDGTSRIKFEVILVDTDSPMAIEKRAWEMYWKNRAGVNLYPEGHGKDSMSRLKTKIGSCVTVANIFAEERPRFFSLKLTQTLPLFAFIMRDDSAIGIIYNLPWKGKDSIIFEVERVTSKEDPNKKLIEQSYGSDFYGYLSGYFDSLWENPNWRVIKVDENTKK